ncbi:hypothetical protein BD769DRAFT_1776392 [Suillus cothurnatus]|nr:hypothetical protein BD769DRAFT_1776392 [Suillus cothurnatus]
MSPTRRLAPNTTKHSLLKFLQQDERFDEEDRSRTYNKARRIQGIHVARYRGSKQQRSSSKRIATESGDNTMSIWRLEDGMELKIQKKWEVNILPKTDVLPNIIATLFPTLVTIADGMLNTCPSQPASQEIPGFPAILHLILKTYKTAIIVNLFPHQQSPESLVPWGRPLFRVVGMAVPIEGVPTDEEDQEKCEWWKAKNFGNPSQLPSPMQSEYGVFAEHFMTTFTPEIFKVYLYQVELYVSGQAWLGKNCQYQIFQFFTECIKPKSTWILLKPQVDSFGIHPAHFQHTQINYLLSPVIHASVSYAKDEYENISSPVSGATSFLLSLASNRTKTSFLSMLQFINTVLQSYIPHFGALTMMSVLGPFIVRYSNVKGSIEQFMVQYVLPEFTSQEPYLQSVACEVSISTTSVVFALNLNNHSSAVALAIDDRELPVRVQAALAITELAVVHDSVRDAVSPQIGKVVQDLLKLSDETDFDILNHSMEAMVDRFQNELLPDIWDEDSAYLEILAKEGARLREKSKKTESGDDESDISEESEIEEELGFFSPLDNANIYGTFKQALQTFQNQNSALYQAATTMLTVERQTVLMEVVTIANQADRS